MDSMRNLHSSLPRPSRRKRGQPSAELHQAFRTAALSVTQLYKTAAGDEEHHYNSGHEAGYQDALDDLLDFLDSENLGVGDGEGWAVRQWATQRHAATAPTAVRKKDSPAASDSDSERSISPRASLKQPAANVPQKQPAADTQPISESQSHAQSQLQHQHAPEMFHFRATQSLPPSSLTGESDDMQLGLDRPTARRSPSAVRVELVPHSSARGRRSGALGAGAGSKRRAQMADFFDLSGISGFGEKRDPAGGGGGKRGRFV